MDNGAAVCYIIYLDSSKSNIIQYLGNKQEDYIKLLDKFLMENPNDQRP